MTHQKLPHYLRTHRKRLGLSQIEVAFLLGTKNGESVCRHEAYCREPSLRTVMAYEIIFKAPMCELCSGMYQEVYEQVLIRIRLLSDKLNASDPPHPRHARRRANVEALLLKRLIDNHSQT